MVDHCRKQIDAPLLLTCEAIEINSREPTQGGQTPRSIIHEVPVNGSTSVCDRTGGVAFGLEVGDGDLLDTLASDPGLRDLCELSMR